MAPVAGATPPKRSKAWIWVLGGVVLGCPAAVVLLGLIVAVLAPSLLRPFRNAGLVKAQTDIASLHSAIEEYAIRNDGRYPASLLDLVTPDRMGYRYLQATRVPEDPWGAEYRYDPPRPAHPEPRVWSLGKDGRPGSADDVDRTTPPPR